jgi:hypothetical protein
VSAKEKPESACGTVSLANSVGCEKCGWNVMSHVDLIQLWY